MAGRSVGPKNAAGGSFLKCENANVCIAGAPLFEGRWIPDSGEIIRNRIAWTPDLSA
jgi:hypothetical protein